MLIIIWVEPFTTMVFCSYTIYSNHAGGEPYNYQDQIFEGFEHDQKKTWESQGIKKWTPKGRKNKFVDRISGNSKISQKLKSGKPIF